MKRVICAIEKEVHGRFDTVARSLSIESLKLCFKFVPFQIT